MEDIKINIVRGELIIYGNAFPWHQVKFRRLLKVINDYSVYNDADEIYRNLEAAIKVSRAVWYGVGNINKGKRCDKNLELLEVFKNEECS